jgi:hypothetical protein
MLAAAGAGLVTTATAIRLAMGVAGVSLWVHGWKAGRMRHARLAGQVWSALRTLGIGLAIVVLKAAVH